MKALDVILESKLVLVFVVVVVIIIIVTIIITLTMPCGALQNLLHIFFTKFFTLINLLRYFLTHITPTSTL